MKITRSIVIELEQWERLQTIAEEKQTSVSAIVRQAINDKITEESK